MTTNTMKFEEILGSSCDPCSFLMHCRPKDNFHLGNIYCLNKLHALLEKGHFVTILILPFEEEIQENNIALERLYEDIGITKSFFRKFFDSRYSLTVASCVDFDLDSGLLSQAADLWTEMLKNNHAQVRNIIHKARKWGFNASFVSKCVASICYFRPSHIIVGEKHEDISLCFKTIIDKLDLSISPELVSIGNFADYNGNPMDGVGYRNSCISILDTRNVLASKLLLADTNKVNVWLGDCLKKLVHCSPDKYIDDGSDWISKLTKDQTRTKIEILCNYIERIRQDLVYPARQNVKKFEYAPAASDAIDNKKGDKQQIEKILDELFSSRNVEKLRISKCYDNGLSGALVLEVLVSSSKLKGYTNAYIIKIDFHQKITEEYENYKRYIEPNKTFAFMDVSKPSRSFSGKGGLRYQHVRTAFGEATPKVLCLREVLLHLDDSLRAEIIGTLTDLITNQVNHTLYSHGYEKIEHQSLKQYYGRILPPEYIIQVDSYDGKKNKFVACDSADEKHKVENAIINDTRENGFSLYDLANHCQVDVQVKDPGVETRQISASTRTSVEGYIQSTRRDFYRMEIEKIEGIFQDETITFDGSKYRNVVEHIDELLGREHQYICTSPVHGDFHTNNIMVSGKYFAVIDYGRVKEQCYTAYDCVTLLCDIIILILPQITDISVIVDRVCAIFELRQNCGVGVKEQIPPISREAENLIDLLSIFRYAEGDQPTTKISTHLSQGAFYTAISLHFLVLAKFSDISVDSKKLAYILSCLFCEKVLSLPKENS